MVEIDEKVKFFFDPVSFFKLLTNPEFTQGRDLKAIIRNRAEVYLLVSESDLKRVWDDNEHPLRKSCDGFDIPRPKAYPEYERIFKNPALCYQIDPFAIWFLNIDQSMIDRFRDSFGLWVWDASTIKDNSLYIHHKKEYEKDDVIEGSSSNGWKNYLEDANPKVKLPPFNSIVINDRHLINNTNEKSAIKRGFYGLNNLVNLLDAFLPDRLSIPFQICIYCQHPKLSSSETHKIIQEFRKKVAALRSNYSIDIDFLYDVSKHKRTFHSNYFLFDLDRGYNAFYDYDRKKLNGENEFCLESYFNDPNCSGDTNYFRARKKISIIQSKCEIIEIAPFYPSDYDPKKREDSYEKIQRADVADNTFVKNRLFL